MATAGEVTPGGPGWDALLGSERDAIRASLYGPAMPTSPVHEHRYKGGLPPMRLRRLQIAAEGRARRRGLPWDMVDFRAVYKEHNGCCGICRAPLPLEEFTIDHIVPLSRGGPHVFANLQPAHRSCNSSKRDK